MLLFEFRRVFSQLRPVLKRVRDESRKAITQEEPLPVGFSFRNERQQYVPMPRQNFFDAEDFQRFSDIEHFGNRRRLLQTPASERPRQTRNLSVNIPAVAPAFEAPGFVVLDQLTGDQIVCRSSAFLAGHRSAAPHSK